MGTLLCDEAERCLFESVAQEVNKLAGTEGVIYLLEQDKSQRHPLYDEPIDMVYQKNSQGKMGIKCPVFFKAPDRTYTSGEEGHHMDRISEFFVSVADLRQRNMRRPRLGDIIYAWGRYYDVTESHGSHAYIADTGGIPVEYRVPVARRMKAPPEGLWIRED